MIRVTSCSSAFILSRLDPPGVSLAPWASAAVCAVRVSSYSRVVLEMNVSTGDEPSPP